MVDHDTEYQTVSNAYFSFQRLKRQEYLRTHLNKKVIILMIYIPVTGVLQCTVKKCFIVRQGSKKPETKSFFADLRLAVPEILPVVKFDCPESVIYMSILKRIES